MTAGSVLRSSLDQQPGDSHRAEQDERNNIGEQYCSLGI